MRVHQEAAISVKLDLTVLDCPACGAVFAATGEFLDRRRADGHTFFCPAGHQMSYGNGKSQRERDLEAELERQKKVTAQSDRLHAAEREQRKAAERQAAAYKGVATRTKNRIARGICPCCTRSFANLARHMETKHPDYIAQEITA